MKTKQNWQDFVDNNLADRSDEKMRTLSRFYKSNDGVVRYTNIEDHEQSIKQVEWIAIAELLQEGSINAAGYALKEALYRVCTAQARDELDEEFELLNGEE